jgi:hypothetical protein
MLGWILEKLAVVVWTGFSWLRRSTSGGGSYGHGEKLSGFIKCWKILE